MATIRATPNAKEGGERLLVKRVVPEAVLPVKAKPGDAGYDLASAEKTIVPARGKQIVSTGLIMVFPEGTYGRVAPRSGYSWMYHLDVGGGVIDRSYRGITGVMLFNHSDSDVEINIGDRIAQVILERISDAIVEEVDTLETTERGNNGFGSTGVSSLEKKTQR